MSSELEGSATALALLDLPSAAYLLLVTKAYFVAIRQSNLVLIICSVMHVS